MFTFILYVIVFFIAWAVIADWAYGITDRAAANREQRRQAHLAASPWKQAQRDFVSGAAVTWTHKPGP